MAHIHIRPEWQLPENAATPENVYRNRREFLQQMGLGAIGLGAAGWLGGVSAFAQDAAKEVKPLGPPLAEFTKPEAFADVGRKITNEEVATGFTNFYEFSFQKQMAKVTAKDFRINPYTLTIDGLVDKPTEIGLEDIEKIGLEQRVYRFRCVEAWSMVVPWLGVPLHKVLEKAGVKDEAKYIAFTSFDDDQAPNMNYPGYPFPYYEALTIEEAMNELTLVTTGMFGKRLPPQNGTPLRVIIPWKYGFKGPKSVVKMTLTKEKPKTFWSDVSKEYTFEANVEPDVPHPRWSQAEERVVETGEKIPTLKYNGYGDYVAKLYA